MTTTWRTYSPVTPTASPTSRNVRHGFSVIILRILSRLGLIPLLLYHAQVWHRPSFVGLPQPPQETRRQR